MSDDRTLAWLEELPCAVTVCDDAYTILYLNRRSAEVNARDGGKALIGRNMLDCHPPEAREKLRNLMRSGTPNIYTIEKNGVRKMIYQTHWRQDGAVRGLLEVTFELPAQIPHFVRAPAEGTTP